MRGDKLGRQPEFRNQEPSHWEVRPHSFQETSWETRQQRQPRAKSWRETSLGDKLAAAAKSEIMKGDFFDFRSATTSRLTRRLVTWLCTQHVALVRPTCQPRKLAQIKTTPLTGSRKSHAARVSTWRTGLKPGHPERGGSCSEAWGVLKVSH